MHEVTGFFIFTAMTFKPRKSLYILITVVMLIGIIVPYLILQQEGGYFRNLETKQWIKVFIPSFFFFGGIRLLFLIKRIEIDHGIWRVTTLITGKEFIFSKEDVAEVKVFTSISHKYRYETGNLWICFHSKKKLKLSSRQMVDFDKLIWHSKKLNRRH